MNEKIIQPVVDPIFTNPKGAKVYLPMEYCTSLSPQWFWTGEQFLLHPSVDTIPFDHHTITADDTGL